MFNHLLTERIQELLNRAKSLHPGSSIQIEIMQDEQLKAKSAGAAVVEKSPGVEVVYLDLERADEYALAHELMHIILHRSGWPQMFSLIGRDLVGRRLADTIDNILDHAIFNPWLDEMGFDAARYQESYFVGFNQWAEREVGFPSYLWNGLVIWECFTSGKEYRERVIRMLQGRHPKAMALARELEKQSHPARSRTKRGNRQAMIQIIDYLNPWVAEQLKADPPRWRERLGISPLFLRTDLSMPVDHHLSYQIYRSVTDQYSCWVGGVYLKADNTRIRGYLAYEAPIPPPELHKIQARILNGPLGLMLEREGIRYGLLRDEDEP